MRFARQPLCMLGTCRSTPLRSRYMKFFHALGSWRKSPWASTRTAKPLAGSALFCMSPPRPHPKWSLGLFCLSNTGSFVISRLEDSLTRGLLADWCCEAITSWKYGNFCSRNGVYEHLVLIRVPLFCRYYTREDTEDSVKYISGTILDDRPVRVDFDWGFQEGRQWGRGRSGGQVCCFTSKTYNEFFRSHSQWMLPLWIQSRTWWWQVCWPLHMCGMASCRFGMNTAQTMMLISSQLSGCCWLFCLGLLWEFTLEIMDKLRNSGQYMSERIDEMSDDWSTYIGRFCLRKPFKFFNSCWMHGEEGMENWCKRSWKCGGNWWNMSNLFPWEDLSIQHQVTDEEAIYRSFI